MILSLFRTLAVATTVAFVAIAPAKSADVTFSAFDDFETQLFPPMGISWSQAGTDQYIQNLGFVSIAPVGSGNPMGDGYFIAGMPGVNLENPEPAAVDMTGSHFFNLTARVDAGNGSTILRFRVYDNEFTEIGSAVFLAANLGPTFTTVSEAITYTGFGDATMATYFRIEGDGIASSAFRYSFAHATATVVPTAVPEPSVYAIAFMAFLGLWIARREIGKRRQLATARARR